MNKAEGSKLESDILSGTEGFANFAEMVFVYSLVNCRQSSLNCLEKQE